MNSCVFWGGNMIKKNNYWYMRYWNKAICLHITFKIASKVFGHIITANKWALSETLTINMNLILPLCGHNSIHSSLKVFPRFWRVSEGIWNFNFNGLYFSKAALWQCTMLNLLYKSNWIEKLSCPGLCANLSNHVFMNLMAELSYNCCMFNET